MTRSEYIEDYISKPNVSPASNHIVRLLDSCMNYDEQLTFAVDLSEVFDEINEIK